MLADAIREGATAVDEELPARLVCHAEAAA
jgi:hypothetical protein